nr:hypothetical protein [Phytohabitans flavus]
MVVADRMRKAVELAPRATVVDVPDADACQSRDVQPRGEQPRWDEASARDRHDKIQLAVAFCYLCREVIREQAGLFP